MVKIERRDASASQNPQRILIYGDSKVGKSTFAAGLENALIVDTGNNYEFLAGTIAPVDSLTDLRELVKLVKNGDTKFDQVVIDDLDTIISWVEDSVCGEAGVGHLGEIPMGGGFTKVRQKMTQIIEVFNDNFDCVVLIATAKRITMGEKNVEFDTITTDFAGKLKNTIFANTDTIGYFYRTANGEPRITFDGSGIAEVGSRLSRLAGEDVAADWSLILV